MAIGTDDGWGDLFNPPPPPEKDHLWFPQGNVEEWRLWAKEGYRICESCGGNIKVYHSKLGVAVRLLVWMAGQTAPGEWVHVPSLPASLFSRGGDYAKLRYWKLMEPMPKSDVPNPAKRAPGQWRLTALGRRFALEEIQAPTHYFWQHPGGFIGYETTMVDVMTALGKRYHHYKLLNGIDL